MRAIIFLFIISSINLLGQSQYKKDMDIFNLNDPDLLKLDPKLPKDTKTNFSLSKTYPLNEKIWILDSTHIYKNKTKLEKKIIITNHDKRGNITESLLSILDDTGDKMKWIKKDTISYFYFNNNELNEQLQGTWDNLNNEFIDTFYYLKQNINGQKTIKIEIQYNSKEIFSYSNKGKIIKEYYVNNYKNGDNYIDAKQKLFKYDSFGNTIEETSQDLQYFTNNYINNSQELFYYDINNNRSKTIKKKWNTSLGKWIDERKWEYIVDDKNNEVEFNRKKWNSDDMKWTNEFKGILEFDNNHNNISYLIQKWDNTKNNWENFNQYFYSYDVDNKATGYFSQIWNTENNKWENFNQFIYDFDIFENRILYIKQKWEKSEKRWINIFKRTKKINSKNIELEIFSQNWSQSNNKWINDHLTSYFFDNNDNLVQKLEKKWDNTNSDWILTRKTNHFWSQFETTSLEKTSRNDFFIYPNPASNTLEINPEINFLNNDVDIYTISGNLILKTKISSNNQINLYSIPSGIYYLKLNTQKGTITRKFIKIN